MVQVDARAASPSSSAGGFLGTALKSASLLSVSMAITIPLGLVSKIMVPRYLGTDQAGLLYFGESFPLLLLSLMSLGIPQYIAKHVPTRPELAREIFDTVFWFSVGSGVLLLAVLYQCFRWYGYDQQKVIVTVTAATTQALTLLCSNVFQATFLASNQVRFTAILNVFSKALAVGIVLPLLWTGGSIEAVSLGFLAAQGLVLALMMGQAVRLGLWGAGFKLSILRTVIGSSFFFFASGLVGQVNGSIDSACLEKLASFHEIGLYAAAYRLIGLFLLLIPLLAQAFSPSMARALSRGVADYQMLFRNAMRILLALTLPLSLGFTAFSHDVVVLLYGAEFASAAKAIAVFGPAMVVIYVCFLAGVHIFQTDTGRRNLASVAIGLGLNFLGDLVFIPIGLRHFGDGGAGVGCALATVVAQGVEATLFFRFAKVKVMTPGLIYRIAAAMAPSLLLVGFLPSWFALGFWLRLGICLLFVPTYLVASRLITVADIRLALTALRSRRSLPKA